MGTLGRLAARTPSAFLVSVAIVAGIFWLPRPGLASPFGFGRVGDLQFAGPASTDLSSVHWNPAAVGARGGLELAVTLGGQMTALSWARTPIDPATGLPASGSPGARAFATARGNGNRLTPSPFAPGGFLGFSLSLGTRISFGLAAYTPFADRAHFADPDGETSARYHTVSTDLRHLALVPAVSLRIAAGVRLGVTFGSLFSGARVVVDEDTALSRPAATDCGGVPCGVENPLAAERYDLASGFGLLERSHSFTLSLGLHVTRPRYVLGLAYLAHAPGSDHELSIDANTVSLTPAPRTGVATPCPGIAPSRCASGTLFYRLPRLLMGEVRWLLGPAWQVGLLLQWAGLSAHDALRLRIKGPASGALGALGFSEQLVLHRGLSDTFGAHLRAEVRLGAAVRLAFGLRGETSPLKTPQLSPAFIGGATLEPGAAVRIFPARWLALTLGYAFTFTPTRSVELSAYDPGALAACAAAGGDLGSPACAARRAGLALPTAAGRYTRRDHHLRLSLSATF